VAEIPPAPGLWNLVRVSLRLAQVDVGCAALSVEEPVSTWRCRACLSVNASRTRKCAACKKARPKKRRPAHLKALDLPYETYVDLNGGETCGICGAVAKTRKLHRDHEHKGSGKPRGLLCFPCNAALRPYMDLAWIEAAARYLRRAA
jgi:hypothetical protein